MLPWTGIPIGVGVGATKVLAKVANSAAKKIGGVCVLHPTTDAGRTLLDGWPCREVWGVSGATEAKLANLGINTAGELSRAPLGIVRRRLGVVGEHLALELRGVSCIDLEEVEEPRKEPLLLPLFWPPGG